MLLCIDVERRELQERDERVPVVRECVREREARGRWTRSVVVTSGTWGGAKHLPNCLALACLSLSLGLGRGASWQQDGSARRRRWPSESVSSIGRRGRA